MKEVFSFPSFTYSVKAYSLLTKPGILLGNMVTAIAGFALGSKGYFDFSLFLVTLLGLSAIIASGCVFNNYIDRHADQKMQRTKRRALATGEISATSALFFGGALAVLGSFLLGKFTHMLTLIIAFLGLFIYVVLYSISKYYSIHGTLIGSIAGAIPPLASYVAAKGSLAIEGIIFFAVMVVWQMPHFFAIAVLQMEDYKKANIPTLPLKKGMLRTKIETLIYCLAFLFLSFLLSFSLGRVYLLSSLALSLYWLCFAIEGFFEKEERLWAKSMFRASLTVIFLLSGVITYVALSKP